MSAVSRKPWAMRWIVVAILAVIVPYTYITLKYRKPNKAFEPYADMKAQANVNRLLDAGYRRAAAKAELPFPALPPDEITRGTAAALAPADGGLPDHLGRTLVEPPRLPLSYEDVLASAEIDSASPARLQFTARIEHGRDHVTGAELFVHDGSLVIVPVFGPAAASTAAGNKHDKVLLTLPANLLPPGSHAVTLAGARDSVTWIVLVR